ncbi:Cupredoxin [Hyaloraphidium curvatum]|nr:Cupredoxin [Hyaloraphidium curvatum]
MRGALLLIFALLFSAAAGAVASARAASDGAVADVAGSGDIAGSELAGEDIRVGTGAAEGRRILARQLKKKTTTKKRQTTTRRKRTTSRRRSTSKRVAKLTTKAPVPTTTKAAGGSGTTHTVRVGVVGFNFAPSDLSIAAGDTVLWVWSGSGHSVTETDSGGCTFKTGGFDSGVLSSPASYSRTFASPGTVRYSCNPHCFTMEGTITVA